MMKQNIYGNLVDDTIQTMEISKLRSEFQALDDRERLNPGNVMLRVVFMHAFNQTEQHKYNQFQLDRKLYGFFIEKNSNILDIKDRI
jgi:hypothetical protein